MSGFEVGHPRAYMLQLQEFRTRVDNGWVPFGWHVGYPGVRLDFDGRDELSGDPVWERNANWGLSFTEQEADRNARGDVAWAELNTDPYEHPGYCDDPDCAECPRPCCHTTGPHHHPACTTNRTEQQ